jgi:hypothetical protein
MAKAKVDPLDKFRQPLQGPVKSWRQKYSQEHADHIETAAKMIANGASNWTFAAMARELSCDLSVSVHRDLIRDIVTRLRNGKR